MSVTPPLTTKIYHTYYTPASDPSTSNTNLYHERHLKEQHSKTIVAPLLLATDRLGHVISWLNSSGIVAPLVPAQKVRTIPWSWQYDTLKAGPTDYTQGVAFNLLVTTTNICPRSLYRHLSFSQRYSLYRVSSPAEEGAVLPEAIKHKNQPNYNHVLRPTSSYSRQGQ